MECCRICLSSNNLTNIFDSEEIANNITTIACVDITQDDGFPQFICLLCKHELDISISFKDKCESTFEMLKQQHSKEIEVKEDIILNLLSGGSVLDEKMPEQARNCVLNTVRNNIMGNIVIENVDSDISENDEEYGCESQNMEDIQCLEDILPNEEDISGEDKSSQNFEYFEIHMGDTNEDDTEDNYAGNYVGAPEPQDDENLDIMCVLCDLSFINEETFLTHLKQSHPTTMCQCQVCLRYFSTEQTLKEHLFEKHDILDENTFRCKVCSGTFELQSQLNSHLCPLVGKRKFRCECCQMCFTQHAELQSHIHYNHKPLEFSCEYCSTSFNMYDQYKKHLSEHAMSGHQVRMLGNKRKVHTCQSRTTDFNKKYTSYKCPHCTKSFENRPDFTVHLESHIRSKPHVCSICRMAFSKGHDLEKHLLGHDNLIRRTKEEIYVFKIDDSREYDEEESIGEEEVPNL